MKTIAVIDDDIHIGNVLEELLQREGYAVLRPTRGRRRCCCWSGSGLTWCCWT